MIKWFPLAPSTVPCILNSFDRGKLEIETGFKPKSHLTNDSKTCIFIEHVSV